RDRVHAGSREDRRPPDADAERRRAAAAGLRRLPRVPRPARRCAATARGGDAAGADGGALMRQRVFAALFLAGYTLGTHRDAVARHFIAALQTAPTDPIAELAALRLLDLEGESPQIDELIAGAADALRPPVAPRAARLVREAAARISTRRAAAARDPRMELEAWRSVGAVQRWRVGGPFAALRLFDLRRTLPLDGRVSSAATVNDRALEFPDGDAGLDLEPADGDIFYAVSEVTL